MIFRQVFHLQISNKVGRKCGELYCNRSLALPDHQPVTRSSPLSACLSLFPITRLSYALPYQSYRRPYGALLTVILLIDPSSALQDTFTTWLLFILSPCKACRQISPPPAAAHSPCTCLSNSFACAPVRSMSPLPYWGGTCKPRCRISFA